MTDAQPPRHGPPIVQHNEHGQPFQWNGQQWIPMQPQPPVVPPKKKHTVRNIVLGIVGSFVLIFVLAVACSSGSSTTGQKIIATNGDAPSVSTSKSSSSTGTAHIGDSIEVTDHGNVAVITVSDLKPSASDGFGTINGKLWQVTVTIHVKSGKWSANPLYYTARTQSGQTINAELAGIDNGLQATEGTPGETISGAVGFDIPNGESVAKIIEEGTTFGRIADWSA